MAKDSIFQSLCFLNTIIGILENHSESLSFSLSAGAYASHAPGLQGNFVDLKHYITPLGVEIKLTELDNNCLPACFVFHSCFG